MLSRSRSPLSGPSNPRCVLLAYIYIQVQKSRGTLNDILYVVDELNRIVQNKLEESIPISIIQRKRIHLYDLLDSFRIRI